MKTVVSAAVIATSVLLAYSNSYSGPFVLDDLATIVESPSIRRLWPIQPVIFNAGVSTTGRPLVNLSFALNYAFGGLNVVAYHVTNAVIHVLAALALFGVVRRTCRLPGVSSHLSRHATPIAMFCALIWGLHPLQTESVTYIVQRAESLAGLFYFLTLYCAIRAASSERPVWWAAGSFFSCLCGVASKEIAVSAPLAVVVYDWAFSGNSIRTLLVRRWRLYAALFSTWIPLAFLVSLGREQTAGFGYGIGSWDYAMTQFGAIVRYLHLAFWPDALVLDYGASVARNPRDIVPAAILVGLLASGTIGAFRALPWVTFLGFIFFAVLSPSSSFIPLATQTIAEHRMYVPLAPVVIIAVLGIWQIGRWVAKVLAPLRAAASTEWLAPCLLLSVISISLGTLTYFRNFEYQDHDRLWMTNIRRCPSSLRPYIQMAKDFLAKDPGRAIPWFDRGIKAYELVRRRNGITNVVDFHLAVIYSGRGTALTNLGKFDLALTDFDQALKRAPSLATAHFYRGLVLGQLERNDEALASLTKAIRLETTSQQLFVRASILSKTHRYDEAIADLNKAITMDPNNPYYLQSRGRCLLASGRYEDCLSDYSQAIRLNPDLVKSYHGRAAAYAAMNRHSDAIEDLSQVLNLSPDSADAHRDRAKSLLAVGRIEEAQQDLRAFEKLSQTVDPELSQRLEELTANSSPKERRTIPSE